MSSNPCCSVSNNNLEKLVSPSNGCSVPACACFSNLYCKICNLLGPYNGSDVQKLSLFTVSASLNHRRASPSIIENDIAITSSSVENNSFCRITEDKNSSITQQIQPKPNPAEYCTNNYGQFQDEASLHQDNTRKRAGTGNKR